jgi:DNA polymerase-3 subunit epsilon
MPPGGVWGGAPINQRFPCFSSGKESLMSGCVAVALDFETADYGADSACALGMARVRDGKVEACWHSLIRPPRSRVHFTEIHGLTWAMVKNCPPFAEIWPECEAFLQGAQ